MAPPSPDFERFEVLTFDCYGTLIDWETGILRALRAVLGEGGPATDDALLEAYAGHELRLEGGPWHTYRAVLEQALSAVCLHFGVRPTPEQAEAFGSSVADWPPFADSAAALARLGRPPERSCMSPRACSTTTPRHASWASPRRGSTAAATAPALGPLPRRLPRPT